MVVYAGLNATELIAIAATSHVLFNIWCDCSCLPTSVHEIGPTDECVWLLCLSRGRSLLRSVDAQT